MLRGPWGRWGTGDPVSGGSSGCFPEEPGALGPLVPARSESSRCRPRPPTASLPLLPPAVDEEFEVVSAQLLKRTQAMLNKYRLLLLEESRVRLQVCKRTR